MTERYILDDAGTLIDIQTRNTYDYVSDVCPLLNALNDENEQLKSRINDYDVALKRLQDLADRKLKENEQLKQENKELKMDKDSLATGFDEYQVQVAETLQKHYNQTLNTHIARFVKLLAEELGIDLQ